MKQPHKVTGKSIFTLESVLAPNKVVKPEIQQDIDVILELMKKHELTKVELQ